MIKITTKLQLSYSGSDKSYVYKIQFDNGYFYIGRTDYLKPRFLCHKTSFKNITNSMTKRVLETGATSGEFILIKSFRKKKGVTPRVDEAWLLERDLIMLNGLNPYCVNKVYKQLLKLNSI